MPRSSFDDDSLERWSRVRCLIRAVCNGCGGARKVGFGRTTMAGRYICKQCGTETYMNLFETKAVDRCVKQKTVYDLVCLECKPSQLAHLTREKYSCNLCARTLPLTAFSPVIWKGKDLKRWRCLDCQQPICQRCGGREEQAMNRPVDPTTFVCQACIYPPCAGGCGAERYRRQKYKVDVMPVWFCSKCRKP